MNKRVFIKAAAAAMAAAVLSGCAGGSGADQTETAAETERPAEAAIRIAEGLLDKCGFSEELTAVSGEDVPYIFYTGNMLEYGSVYFSNVSFQMLAVMRCRSEEYTEAVEMRMKSYVQALLKQVPEDGEDTKLLQNYVLLSKGLYVVLAVSPDSSAAEAAVHEALEAQS